MHGIGKEIFAFLAVVGVTATLSACGGGGGGGPGRPQAPTGFTATSDDTGRVTLDWNLVSGATAYNIYWDTASGVTQDTGTQISGVFPPYDHAGRMSGATYSYVVTAVKGSRESLDSTEASAMPLDAPTGVSAKGGTAEVIIDWSPVIGAETYNIYWSQAPGITKETGVLAAGVSSPYRHFGLTDGFTYFYVVTAANSVGGGSESTESTAVFSMPLPRPTGLSAVGGSVAVTLDWNLVTEANAYNLYWDTNPGVTPSTGTPIIGVFPPYTHTGLTIGTTRYYVVTATNLVGDGAESLASAEVSATPDVFGILDPTFDGVGYVVHADAAGGASDDLAMAITIDTSGRILAAGASMNPSNDLDMVIWRYAADGTIDTKFDGQGWVVLSDLAGGAGDDVAQGIALDGSGRIVVVGSGRNSSGNEDLIIVRLNDDGTLDTTFDGQGWVVQDNAGGAGDVDLGMGMALDGTGRILATGVSTTTAGGADMAIWRFEADGTLDATFNGQGWVTHHDAAAGSGTDEGRAIVLDPSGRIVVTGASETPSLDVDMVVWRFDDDGTLDATFNGQGWTTHHDAAGGAGEDMAEAITVDASGGILVTGWSVNSTSDEDMVVWRFNDDGTPDTAFNSQGWFVHGNAGGGNGFDEGQAIAIDVAGRIVVAGASLTSPQSVALTVWRLNPDGSLDAGFGGGQGWFLAPPSQPPVGDQAMAMTFDALGRIVAAGISYDPNFFWDMVIFRIR